MRIAVSIGLVNLIILHFLIISIECKMTFMNLLSQK